MNINAQTIIAEVLTAQAIAPDECTPNAFVKFQTSARGSHRILNCKENLQRFADLVRKNAAAFGGGLIREEKAKPAIVWPSKTIALFKQCMEDNDYQAAFDIGTGKLGALFFVDCKGRACMQVAPMPLDSEPRLVSVLNEDGKWSVCCPISMLGLDSLTGNKRSRQAQIDAAAQHLRLMKPEKKEAMMANAHARPIDQSAIRARSGCANMALLTMPRLRRALKQMQLKTWQYQQLLKRWHPAKQANACITWMLSTCQQACIHALHVMPWITRIA